MILLIGSILLSSFLTIAFKLCDRFSVNTFQAIVVNYFVCALTGVLFAGYLPSVAHNIAQPWFKWSLIMGTGFILTFYGIATTVQKSGLAVASVASKLSLVIPFLFSLFLYNENVSFVQIAGIVLALAAVVLTLYPNKNAPKADITAPGNSRLQKILLPILVFIGTGLLDSLIKFVEQGYIPAADNDTYLINTFAIAFAVGFILFLLQWIFKKMPFDVKAIPAGIIIGIPNYFSIWCLIKVLKEYNTISSVILPVNNMGIVLFSALVAFIFFKEKLSWFNWTGIVVSLIAIAMITFGN
jgi:drug/metabolite transporter (DMT)-like permease